ncbi:AAA family ATPase [Cellulomonas humilata]|uniref:AAA family ATPase n=1 Tax=Cellulomonas humilata TaxID=144055 RepID=A0A7Y6A4U6_9CELL|nr:AAA family ATPase [Cellulomonas humilata]
MDANMWHRHARAQQPAPPEKLSLIDLHALSSAERAAHLCALRDWLAASQFPTADARRVAATMWNVVTTNSNSGPGAKTIVAVNAPNTIGKSTAVRAWAHEAYRQWVGPRISEARLPSWSPEPGVHAHEVPVAWINLQSAARIRDFNAQILTYFGYPTDGPIRSLSTRIAGAIGRHRVRVLVVDDVHLLDTRFKDGREVLDHLKHVNTELGERGATMVLIGANLHDSPILADPQIAGRLQALEMVPFAVDTLEEKRAWQEFLVDVEQQLLPYLPAASDGLLAKTHVSRIWRRTQGFVGDVSALLRGAVDAAAIDGTWTLHPSHLDGVGLSRRATLHEQSLGSRRPGSIAPKRRDTQ